MTFAVNSLSPEMAKLAEPYPILEALMGGTPAMRLAGAAVLPKFPSEEPESYSARVATATLFPAFKRTVSVMAGKPFAKAATFSDDTPKEIRGVIGDDGKVTTPGWADDIDRQGVNLHTFASEMMAEAIAFGFCGILVEAPKPIQTAGPVPTVAEQKAAAIRPYWVRVMHSQILGYRIEIVDGQPTLTMLRLGEAVTVPDGEFGTKVVERVRVLIPGGWTVYEKQALEAGQTEAKWVVFEAGKSGLSVIPFVPLYGTRLGYMLGQTPLLDLAYMNVKHWQSQSDQDTILHVARVPILFAAGFQDKEAITVGASTAVKVSDHQAKLTWVEHTGAAIDSGATSLRDLEEQMIQSGAELLVKKAGARSATESANDAEANKSDLQRIVEGFEDALDQALMLTAQYASLSTGGNITLFKDFGAALLTDASAQLIVTMEAQGVISTETAIEELQRRGTLSADIEPEDEAERVAAQGPRLGEIEDEEEPEREPEPA